ncbi:MAG TPA: hypothetical protein VFA77_07720 [Candidatus Eisenbacteria bacterium]|nr:hypothetical protein [Candidatus Eisenbacteria bacterium]
MIKKFIASSLAAAGLLLNGTAAVVVTKLDPPIRFIAWDPVLGDPIDVDFNADGRVDFRFLSHNSGLNAYIYQPSRIVAQLAPPPNHGGRLGGLPLNTLVGEQISLPGYDWWVGGALPTTDHEIYGDKLIGALWMGWSGPSPLVIVSDLTHKNSAIGVEFLIGTNKHYGYVHADFRLEHDYGLGLVGYLYGWAYETAPGQPIVTEPIATPVLPAHSAIRYLAGGDFEIRWPAAVGGIYRIQESFNAAGPYVDQTPDLPAAEASEVHNVAPPAGADSYFWRVVRVE